MSRLGLGRLPSTSMRKIHYPRGSRVDQELFVSGASSAQAKRLVRIRSLMGQRLSHPGAVSVQVEDGDIVLTGPCSLKEILTLKKVVSESPEFEGVKVNLTPIQSMSLVDRLEPQKVSFGYQSEFLQPGWAPIARMSVGALGALSVLVSGRLNPKLRSPLRLFGLASLVRALTNQSVTNLIGLIANPILRLNRSIVIDAPVDNVYDFLKDFANFPKFMSYITDVRINDIGGLRWTAKGPRGSSIHWNAIVGELLSNQAISWRSAPGAWVRSSGRFHLSETSDGRSRLEVELSYAPPAGALGYVAFHFLGFDPREKIDEDLHVLENLIMEQVTQNISMLNEN